jgi:hypothetical protein
MDGLDLVFDNDPLRVKIDNEKVTFDLVEVMKVDRIRLLH